MDLNTDPEDLTLETWNRSLNVLCVSPNILLELFLILLRKLNSKEHMKYFSQEILKHIL
jgi:hypothetical protein